MKVIFTQALEEKIPEILLMMEEFSSIDNYSFDKEIRQQNLIEFIHNPNLGRLWTINVNQNTIGYIVLTFGFSFEYKGRDSFIDEFFIKEEFRNKGIGLKTMEFLFLKAVELNIKAIHLEVENHNTNANRLYIKQEFKENNRTLLTKIINK
jgi:ribosomal protein S18 acetylase RimI-like enzyme